MADRVMDVSTQLHVGRSSLKGCFRKFMWKDTQIMKKLSLMGAYPFVLLILLSTQTLAQISPLQLFVDLTPAGQVLRPLPGVYRGSITITKPIILDGNGEVTLDGDTSGTVLTIQSEGAIVRNLKIINSGVSHDQVSAGILVEANSVVVEDNDLDNVLFGIHLKSAEDCTIRGNTIRSIDTQPTLRGEGIRLWNCKRNLIQQNELIQVRDIVFTNSPHNDLVENKMIDSRIGVEMIFSPGCKIVNNVFHHNEHGLIGIYSDSLQIENNRFQHQKDLLGSAIAVKGSSEIHVKGNEILDCATGITANAPIFPENIIIVTNNVFAFNDVGVYLYGDRGGHIFHNNVFKGNFQHILVTHPAASVENDWSGNYWDDYTGFDLDNDGTGDEPYSNHLYSERLWMDRDMIRFFRGSPLLEMIDLMERIVPFSDPPLVLKDERPQVDPNIEALKTIEIE